MLLLVNICFLKRNEEERMGEIAKFSSREMVQRREGRKIVIELEKYF